MARIRTIKPEFFAHYDLYEAEKETGLPLRLAFAGLWTQCDREGRFKWRPEQLKIGCLPYDDVDFSRVLHALSTRGFIGKYESNNACFGVVFSFKEHQVINNREKESVLPEPLEFTELDACGTREPREDHACQGEGKGREGKGREGKGKENKAVAKAPSPHKFSQSHLNLAEELAEPVRAKRPKQKINIDQWADDVRKLNEIDGYTLEQIAWLWTWIQNHEDGNFRWGENILSPSKLRKSKEGLTYFERCKEQAMKPRAKRETDQERRARIIAERNQALGFESPQQKSTYEAEYTKHEPD